MGDGMREAVALALAVIGASKVGLPPPKRPSPGDYHAADAAIAAVFEQLREPTEAMAQAGAGSYGDYFYFKEDHAKECWKAMLDAALHEAGK